MADALSEVLNAIRMKGAVFFDVAARAPWLAEQLSPDEVLPMIFPGAENMMVFHMVTEGHCFAHLPDGKTIELSAGQIILFTRGEPHVISSGPGLRSDPRAPRQTGGRTPANYPSRVWFGPKEAPTTLKGVCGFLGCEVRPFNPLLESLPSAIIVDISKANGLLWLGELVRIAMDEAANGRPGHQSVLAKLTELLVITVLRQHLGRLPNEQGGWIEGLRDRIVGKALSLLHADPSHDWQIGELARQSGTSRSALAARFANVIGVPPMQYLAKWRMHLACGLLSERSNIALVAADVGYSSEASFSRAFKKIVGSSPSYWRDRDRSLEPPKYLAAPAATARPF